MLKRTFLIAACIFCAGNFLWAQKEKAMLSKNVCVLDTAFYMPQLDRHRRIWIYLPESYCTSRKKYPVIYMQDGQNLFDESTSFSGEWGIDESLDMLGCTMPESIVVAVDNGGDKRMNEYAPYDMEQFGKGEGKQYADFMARILKPFVDRKYRTKKSAQHTSIAGSSMGGLISFYTMLQYPQVFGAAGIFSPSFWIAPQLKEEIKTKGKKLKGSIYFYAGKHESEGMVPDLLSIFELLDQYSKAKMTVVIRTEGKHDEATWRKEFPLFYRWLAALIP